MRYLAEFFSLFLIVTMLGVSVAAVDSTAADPTAHLTPELSALVEDYLDGTGDWVADPTGNDLAVLDTDDGGHYRITRDGWLVRDKLYLCPLEQSTAPVDPASLIADYQAGLWDGSTRLSPDYSTTVRLAADGRLYYTYQRRFYSEAADPQHLAYRGYAEDPVYRSAATWPLTEVSNYSSRSDGVSFHTESVYLDCYLDLPQGQLAAETIAVCVTPDGTYVQQPQRTELYRCGELKQTWRVYSQDHGRVLRPTSSSQTYLYTGTTLYALTPTGGKERVAQGIDALYFNGEDHLAGFKVSRSTLQLWQPDQDDLLPLADSVRSFYLGDQVLLLERNDGTYAADAYVSHLAVAQTAPAWLYLGPESLDYYRGYLDADPLNALAQARRLAARADSSTP